MLVGLSGTAARADALYTVANLGSSGVTLTTASGGTIAVSPVGVPTANLATSQLASVSNGQASYSFATTPDTMLEQGQGPLSGLAANYLNPNPSFYGTSFITGLLNMNGYAAISVGLPLASDPAMVYGTAYAVPPGSKGELAWTQGAVIASDLSDGKATGLMTIAGINTANQALVGTTFADQAYNSLVYNFSTNTITDLETLAQISSGAYSNLIPLAIDNEGQILLVAAAAGTTASDVLLLTPNGEPIVSAPEPGTWIIWSLIAVSSCAAARRRTGAPAA